MSVIYHIEIIIPKKRWKKCKKDVIAKRLLVYKDKGRK